MDEPSLTPELQDLQSRLSRIVPPIATSRQQEMLYQCAFAAGRNSVGARLRVWRVATASLAALSLFLVAYRPSVPTAGLHPERSSIPLVEQPPREPLEAPPHESLALVRQPLSVELGAWQVPSRSDVALANQLTQFEQVPPEMQSLTVRALARGLPEL